MSSLYLDGSPSVLIEGSVIQAVGAPAPEGARRLACDGGVVRAGAVNAHTHLYSGLAPLGMPEPKVAPESFVQILERIWWKLDRSLDEASLRAAARLYVAESLLSGTTALIDHHESPAFIEGSLDVLAAAAQSLGCRLVTCYGATDRNGGHAEGQLGLGECRRFLEMNQRPLVRGMVGLHASFTVSDQTVRAAAELAAELGAPVHVHVAEAASDVEDAKTRGFAGPFERLRALGALPAGSILAHGVHLSEIQVAAAEAAGLWLVQNPRSNAGNKVGFARSLGSSKKVALGTDGYPADMRAEARALEEQAVLNEQPLDEAQRRARQDGGYRILSERFGELFAPEPRVGIAADLAVWKSEEEAHQPGAAPLHVIVAGRLVVEHGRLVHGDLEEIRAYAADEAPRVWESMEALA